VALAGILKDGGRYDVVSRNSVKRPIRAADDLEPCPAVKTLERLRTTRGVRSINQSNDSESSLWVSIHHPPSLEPCLTAPSTQLLVLVRIRILVKATCIYSAAPEASHGPARLNPWLLHRMCDRDAHASSLVVNGKYHESMSQVYWTVVGRMD
jgi:hypothetical protein